MPKTGLEAEKYWSPHQQQMYNAMKNNRRSHCVYMAGDTDVENERLEKVKKILDFRTLPDHISIEPYRKLFHPKITANIVIRLEHLIVFSKLPMKQFIKIGFRNWFINLKEIEKTNYKTFGFVKETMDLTED